jgi:IS5 family transposase
LRKLRTYLGRVIRDIGRRIEGNDVLQEVFGKPMSLARRVRDQDRHRRGPKVYSLHAPEVECIGKGKAHRPYEFGVTVSVVTTLKRSSGGQFVAHVAALPGNPYDGHTLGTIIPAMEQMTGNTIERALTDAGYRGHNAPPSHRFKIYTAGQKRRVTPQIKREFKRRAADEPVIGHLKAEHRMGCNHLAHRAGDAINAMLAAVGYNFHILLRWLRLLLRAILAAQLAKLIFNPPKYRKVHRRLDCATPSRWHASIAASRYRKLNHPVPKRRGPRAATYVYRILCGAEPTELPVQISIKYQSEDR